jgi:hypothetical protein
MDARLEQFIGMSLNDEIEEEIKIIGNFSSSRILFPDSIITMDYRPDRVNIHINYNYIITNISIG